MKYYSKTQIAAAKDVDTVDYLERTCNMSFKMSGSEYLHKSDTYGKVVVYPDRKGWIDYTHDVQSRRTEV